MVQPAGPDAEKYWQNQRAKLIAGLNDNWRVYELGKGKTVVSDGIKECGKKFEQEVMIRVRSYSVFTDQNDPLGQHDFGHFDYGGQRILWRSDYYDAQGKYLSDNPADPTQTTRVLQVMRVE